MKRAGVCNAEFSGTRTAGAGADLREQATSAEQSGPGGEGDTDGVSCERDAAECNVPAPPEVCGIVTMLLLGTSVAARWGSCRDVEKSDILPMSGGEPRSGPNLKKMPTNSVPRASCWMDSVGAPNH